MDLCDAAVSVAELQAGLEAGGASKVPFPAGWTGRMSSPRLYCALVAASPCPRGDGGFVSLFLVGLVQWNCF